MRRRTTSYSAMNRAIGFVVERLEPRQLLHGTTALSVNFQPASATVPSGYVVDSGQTYADRGNGWVYGWNASDTVGTRERNANSDQRLDTLIETQAYGSRTWEMAVANGEYQVHLVAGDPSYTDSVYKFDVENTLVVNGTPTSANHFVEGTAIVNVTDGRLTISNAPGAVNNKLAYVDIQSIDDDALPAISLAATHASASESGETGVFTFTRTEDPSAALTVTYKIGGSATNGVDYQQLLGTVTFAAGATTATVSVKPIDDGIVESSETVTATILAGDAYTIATPAAATVTIADNDSASTFSAKINFQPASSTVPAGYLVDSGLAYGARGDGLTYGWSSNISANARDRNLALSPDQRYDTLEQFTTQKWEIAVPNGTYSVHIVSGDPGYIDSVYKINAENVTIISGTPTSGQHWFDATANVTVSDGKLTISSAAGYSNNKIDFLEISPASASAKPTIGVTAPTDNASENGPTSRAFTITRTGDLSKALTVNFMIGGTATNGVDYTTINSPVTIAAGSASATVTVSPIDDPIVESVETVTLTLVSTSAYSIGSSPAATIRINDNDSATGNTITWTTKAANPIIRAEALKAVVDDKLYVFGGFSGDGDAAGPVVTSDVYDPTTNKWTAIADLPDRLTHAGVAVVGHNIYFAGGYIGIGATGYNQQFGTTNTWVYNTDTNKFTAFVPLPSAVSAGGLVLLNNELHYVGGNNNSRQDIGTHYVLDLNNPSAGWKTAVSLPHGRSHMGLVTLNGKIYAIGGQFGNDADTVTQNYVEVWDPANPGVWTELATLPTKLSHFASAVIVVGNRIMTFGGETAYNVDSALVYAYDPATNSWASMTSLPGKRFSGVAAVLDGNIYFTTGSSMTTTWEGVVS